MKIIFLDIDGVVNTSANKWETGRIKFRGRRCIPTNREPKRVLAKLIKWMLENDIYFVMSTSWGRSSTAKDWNEILKNYGINKNLVISRTPVHETGKRGLEILQWLEYWNTVAVEKYGKERVDGYIVIDDDVQDILPYVKPKSHVIHTDVRKGLTEKDLEKIKVYFKKHKSIGGKNVREKL